MKKILILDNYDSFTYNLVHLVEKVGNSILEVFRNDKISLEDAGMYDKILLSPGPGLPLEAGIMPQIVEKYSPTKSILGVCLGHQCIGEVFGGKLYNLPVPVHGKASEITISKPQDYLFSGLPKNLKVARYHSWVVDKNNIPDCIEITATDKDSVVMALSHKTYDVKGVQFHPESIMTEYGQELIANWINK
jgi:anthranilate synthase component 2